MHVVVAKPKIRPRFLTDENTFSMAESEEFVFILYESNHCQCCDDVPTNTTVSVDFQQNLLVGETALVNEWTLGDCQDCYYYYYLLEESKEYCAETFP